MSGITMSRTAMVVLLVAAFASGCADQDRAAPDRLRVATFNIRELSTGKLLTRDSTGRGRDPQARAAADLIQRVRPDIILLNEIDHDHAHPDDLALNARRFIAHYLAHGRLPIDYPHIYAAPSNTGVLSGLDLDGNGTVATDADRGTRAHGDDAFGFGTYPGQYAMAVLSRYPIDTAAARTFQRFLWRDLPGHHIPAGHYSARALEVFRLSSKSHWDVPVIVAADTLHLLASHPTPPVFDGPEDRNGRRNHDEVGFWSRYLDDSDALHDDRGRPGGLAAGALFVILGDLNATPDQPPPHYDGVTAIAQLLADPRIQDPPGHRGRSTAFFDRAVRPDYVLPSADLAILDSGVFWPDSTADPTDAALAAAASDHRLVWVDVHLPMRHEANR
jgi:endonuclease/exonuclease/phosphatase family metal-dependent hydrolase